MKLPNLQHKKGRLQALLVSTAVVAVLSLALFFGLRHQTPLSSEELQLVGEWYWDDPNSTRRFSADRSFSTSNGQFVGVWGIDDGQLTLTYWQPFRRPLGYRIADVVHSIRRTRKTAWSWDITFADNDQQHILSVSVSELSPDGQWIWRRMGDE